MCRPRLRNECQAFVSTLNDVTVLLRASASNKEYIFTWKFATMGRQKDSNLATASTRVTRSHAPIIDPTGDNSNTQSATTAPAPGKRARQLKRKAGQENDDNDEFVMIESKSTPVKAIMKGKAKAPAKGPSPKKQKKDVSEEKRLSRWRAQPTQQLRDRIHRCLTQRMVVLDRERNMESHPPEETFKIAGSTGNVYQVLITNKSSCNCPDGIKVRTSLMDSGK